MGEETLDKNDSKKEEQTFGQMLKERSFTSISIAFILTIVGPYIMLPFMFVFNIFLGFALICLIAGVGIAYGIVYVKSNKEVMIAFIGVVWNITIILIALYMLLEIDGRSHPY